MRVCVLIYLEMPGTKRQGNGKANFSKKRFVKKKQTFPRQELKFVDTAEADSAIGAAGEIYEDSVVEIDQGTGDSNRVGRKVIVRSMHMRYSVSLPNTSAGGSTSDILRIIVYQDKQANGATAAVTDILEAANIFSFNNLSNKGRFRSLMDKTHNIGSTTGAGNGTTNVFGKKEEHYDWHSKDLSIPLEYKGTGNAIADLTSNNIGILAVSEGGLATLETNVRVRFTDS